MAILGHYRADADLVVSGKVKATAGDSTSGVLDLGAIDSQGLRNEDFELRVTFPAATTTHFPTNTGATFTLQSSDDSTWATGVTDHRKGTITGNTAYSGEVFNFKPSEHAQRYWRIKETTTLTSTGATGSGAGDLVFKIEYLA